MEPQEASINAHKPPPHSPVRNSSGKLKRVLLDSLDEKSSLTSQCRACERDLNLCINYAQQASIGVDRMVKTQLGGVWKRLEENRLRLDLWISDCSVSEGPYLDNLGDDITEVVSGAFSLIHKHLSAIVIWVGQLWHTATGINNEQGNNS
jgi:hypothetical protein